MDKKEEYVNKLAQLKAEATSLINRIKDTETQLENAMDSIWNEIKKAYVWEAKKLTDEIAQRVLNEMEREGSRLGPMFAKRVMGVLAVWFAHRAEKSELARILAKSSLEGYKMDEIEKARIEQASEIVKQRVERQVSSMKREEFTKLLRGGRAMGESLKSMFMEELNYRRKINLYTDSMYMRS